MDEAKCIAASCGLRDGRARLGAFLRFGVKRRSRVPGRREEDRRSVWAATVKGK
jgi:hypothetical protein